MSVVVVSEATETKGIICFFRRCPHSPRDGYYEIRTEQGEFLSNADVAELSGELREYRKQGYGLAQIKGG